MATSENGRSFTPTGATQPVSRQVFTSTPRKQIFFRAIVAALAFAVWIFLMDRFNLKGGFLGFVGMFLIVATVALLVLGLRSPKTVVLDESKFSLRQGRKEVLIPWRVFSTSENPLKFENVLGWRRLNISVTVGNEKVTASLDQILGVGLPVAAIVAYMDAQIGRAKGTGT